jgi:hypothetical protein
MGALVEGFVAAREKHEAQLAESRARDELIDEQRRGQAGVVEADAAFLSEHAMSHTIRSRTMHIDQRRAPLGARVFDPQRQK